MNNQIKKHLVAHKTKDRVCAHCGRRIANTVDHFVPQSKGGISDSRNLMPLCYECNQERKNDMVNPWTYYRYAYKWAIRDCIEYQKRGKRNDETKLAKKF